jgi:hypothetical protein
VVKRGVDGEYHLNAKQELLAFCNEQLKEYKHIKSPITNFTSDWTSGHVLHALVDSCTDATRALPADEAEPVDVARAATAKALADLRIPIMVEVRHGVCECECVSVSVCVCVCVCAREFMLVSLSVHVYACSSSFIVILSH